MFYTVLTIDHLFFHNIKLILFFYFCLVSVGSLQRICARLVEDVWLRIIPSLMVMSGKVQIIKTHDILVNIRLAMETL